MRRHATAEELSAYLDHELPPPRLRLVETHVAACEECRRRLLDFRQVVAELEGLERLAPPPVLGQELVRRVTLEPRPRNLLERFERRVRSLPMQPAVGFTFAMVLSLAVIAIVYTEKIERLRYESVQLLRPEAGSTLEVRTVAGRLFERRQDGWWDEVVPPGYPVLDREAHEPEARALFAALPGLEAFVAEGTAVIVAEDGRAVRILPALGPLPAAPPPLP